MSVENPKFVHHFLPGEDAATVLLLHGTGGDENSLIPLGRELAPRAALLSPRGKVLEDGAPRFFRRFAEGVFDHEDLVTRTYELGEFIEAVAKEYGFDPAKLVAVGYSNGPTWRPAWCSCVPCSYMRRSCSGRWSRSSRR
jgi:phospholipase/carboxylesterase